MPRSLVQRALHPRWMIAAALVILAGLLWIVRSALTERTETRGVVLHAYEVRLALGSARQLTREAEAATRAYLADGDALSLRRVHDAISQEERSLQELQGLTIEHPLQRARVDTLARLIRARGAVQLAVTDAARRGDRTPTSEWWRSNGGLAMDDSVMRLIGSLDEAEQAVLRTHSERLTELSRLSNVLAPGALAVVGLLALIAYWSSERAGAARRRADAARREADLRLRLAFRTASMGIWELNPDSGRVLWTPELGPIFGEAPGWAPENFEAFLTRVHAEDRAGLAEQIRRVAEATEDAGEAPARYRAVHADGSLHYMQAFARVEHGIDGQARRIVGITQDVTTQVEATVALAASEARLRAILETMSEGLAVHDADTLLPIETNRAAEEMLGLTREQILGHAAAVPLVTLLDETGAPIPPELWPVPQVRREGRRVSRVVGVQRADGTVVWTHANCIPVRDAATGHLSSILTTFADITQQRAAEQRLARLSLVAEHSTDSVVIADPSGAIEWVNAAFTRQTGYSLDDVCGQRPGPVLQGPDTDPLVAAEMRAAVHGSREFHGEVLNYTKDRLAFWSEIAIVPVRDTQGRVERFISVSRDVTARRETTRVLAERSAAIAQSLDGIVMTNASGGITYANDAYAQQFGVPTGAEIVGRSVLELHDAEDLARIKSEATPTLTSLGDWRGEVAAIHADGTRVPLEIAAHVLPDGGFVSITRDLRAQKRADAELRDARDAALAASRAKSEFLARMNHEIRTPIGAILGFARILILKHGDVLPSTARIPVERILANSEHLLALVNDILDLAKIEAGKLSYEIGAVDLRDLVPQAVSALESHADAKGLTLRCEIPAECAPVQTDALRLRQVLINLTSNALKFTSAGEVTVRVVADPESHAVQAVEVTDTGPGIAANRLSAIFEEFEQENASTARTHGGTGLGLSISQRICRDLGTSLEVESAVGYGSTFRIRGFAA